jgi:hypothetical protein
MILRPFRKKVCCRFLSSIKVHCLCCFWTLEPWVQWQAC